MQEPRACQDSSFPLTDSSVNVIRMRAVLFSVGGHVVFSARRKQEKKKKEIDKSFGIDWTGTASERDVRSQQGATGPAFTHSDKDDTLAPPCGSCAFGRAIEEDN
ncbi:hypothetical protein OUZ56_004537 [Daphnia magna]|uniref:Uncharacterized protein n=1 Tax=Daphnia magna TaxID=35525 RepID=A0ABQ9YQ30_9CRUS|nr:hypothetical protein OUZ56_004537 [Daphnia magna]